MTDHNGNAQGAIFRQASFALSSSDDDDPGEEEGCLDAGSCVNASSSDEQSNKSGSDNESDSSDEEGDDNNSGDDDDSGREETEGTTTTSPASSSSGSGPASSSSTLGKRRRRFTASRKIRLLKLIEKKMQSDNISQRAAAEHFNIHPKQAREWKKLFSKLNDRQRNKKAKSLCNGRASILDPIGEDLLRYIFELRERGMGVSLRMVMIKASSMSREFREKSEEARYHSVRRFVYRNSLRYRMPTHESQRAPSETQSEAIDWLETIRPKVIEPCRDKDYILNMDQTPLPFDYHQSTTLAVIGQRTVHTRKSTCDTKRATCALTVTASGKILKSLPIFKGAPKGRIVTREFPTYSSDMFYACQKNAWMDEEVMLMWVDKVLKPYVEDVPEGIVPILFLDSYRCHMMASVVVAIQELGVEVEHIPGGCTYLCQPVDVGVNKPLKARIRSLWEEWMIDEGLANASTTPPTRKLIAQWAQTAISNISETMVRNAWLHDAYTWFPPTAPTNPTTAAAMATTNNEQQNNEEEQQEQQENEQVVEQL